MMFDRIFATTSVMFHMIFFNAVKIINYYHQYIIFLSDSQINQKVKSNRNIRFIIEFCTNIIVFV